MEKPKPDEKVYFLDKPENVERLLRVFYVICGLLFEADFIVHRHISHGWEQLPAFYAFYGFIACVLLVLIAKLIRKISIRKENYYDVDE